MAKKQEEIKQLEERVNDLEAQLKRAVADYHNLEKRVAEGRSELTNWAATELVKKLLPVLDHLEKATEGASEEEKQSGWYQGVEMSIKQFKDILKSEGLEEIVIEGEFDPALHEAVDTKIGENGKILEVAQKGFTLNGKIIRPTKVVVGKEENKNG